MAEFGAMVEKILLDDVLGVNWWFLGTVGAYLREYTGLVELEFEFWSNQGVKLQIWRLGPFWIIFSNPRGLFGKFWIVGWFWKSGGAFLQCGKEFWILRIISNREIL
jgi:hypothetical protein